MHALKIHLHMYVHITGSGTCIGFNPFLDHLFLVGSESGLVYKCSKAYTKHFLDVTKVRTYSVRRLMCHIVRTLMMT